MVWLWNASCSLDTITKTLIMKKDKTFLFNLEIIIIIIIFGEREVTHSCGGMNWACVV